MSKRRSCLKRKLRSVMVAAITLVLASPLHAADGPEKAAQAAAEKWLALVDAGNYGESYEAGAAFFRKALTKEQWVEAVGKARGPLGRLQSRTLLGAKPMTELPGAPKGEYVVLQYEAKFAGQTAIETITPMKDADGVWRVSGYFVRPR